MGEELIQQQSQAPSLASVKQLLRRLLEEDAGIPPEAVRDDSTVEGDLAIDSYAFVSLQVDVEATLGIECDPIVLAELQRFDAIAAYVLRQVEARLDLAG